MNGYFYELQTSDNVSKKASAIYGKINQYKMEVLPQSLVLKIKPSNCLVYQKVFISFNYKTNLSNF